MASANAQYVTTLVRVSYSCMVAAFGMLLQAVGSIKNYSVHAVVANILETRMNQVLIVRTGSDGKPSIDTINRDDSQPFIEKQLVGRVTALHAAYYKSSLTC